MKKRFVAVGAGLAIVVAAAVVVVNAPANWLAQGVAGRSAGHVLLADADGTVWAGSAVLAFGGADGERLALPGRVTWTLEITRGLAPVLHLTQDAVMPQPVAVRYADGNVSIDAGGADVPTSLLRLAGAPLNTVRPDGRSELRWGALQWMPNGVLTGTGSVRVADLAVALSPVRPLGNYRVDWSSGADGLAWTLVTERGPLQLQGSGRMGVTPSVYVTARAEPGTPAATTLRLDPLLDAIGRRGSGEAVFTVGPRRP